MGANNTNSMWFDNPESALELIGYLLKIDNNHYNDIRVRAEDTNAYVVEWVQLPWSGEWGGHFDYVDENQVVMREYFLPDNSSVLLLNDDEFREFLNDWLKENPGWVQTTYGTWVNELENEKFLKSLQEYNEDCEQCKVE